MTTPKVTLHLAGQKKGMPTFEDLMQLHKNVTGREPTPKELQEAREAYDAHAGSSRRGRRTVDQTESHVTAVNIFSYTTGEKRLANTVSLDAEGKMVVTGDKLSRLSLDHLEGVYERAASPEDFLRKLSQDFHGAYVRAELVEESRRRSRRRHARTGANSRV